MTKKQLDTLKLIQALYYDAETPFLLANLIEAETAEHIETIAINRQDFTFIEGMLDAIRYSLINEIPTFAKINLTISNIEVMQSIIKQYKGDLRWLIL